jgi:MerR family transcriptional regulator, copper efflux regulator
MAGGAPEAERGLMTIGELAHRSGLSIKSIREYEALGLIYSAGRSEANYRLFDESALWCVRMIGDLRSLGLTIKEIQGLTDVYLGRPQEPIGPHLAVLVERAERRIEGRLAELEEIRNRIRAFRRKHAAALAGEPGADLAAEDPRRRAERP